VKRQGSPEISDAGYFLQYTESSYGFYDYISYEKIQVVDYTNYDSIMPFSQPSIAKRAIKSLGYNTVLRDTLVDKRIILVHFEYPGYISYYKRSP
jgi:hypothetical protein